MDIFEKLRALRAKESAKEEAAGPPCWLIVGLGNPGTQYEYTRHNAGFLALDKLAEKAGVKIDRIKFKGLTAAATVAGQRALLLKPQTFMNKSGESVREAMDFYKIPPERTVVLFDDISLPVGALRVRRKGSDGGHNGMKNIILLAGSDQFPRVKLGIGAKPHPDYNLADWVLSHFSVEEGKLLEPALLHGAEAAELLVSGKADEAMNRFNRITGQEKA